MPPERPDRHPQSLRRDAAQNRERVLAAAKRLIAEYGLDVGFNEIAEEAGVGIGTVYRRFPTHDSLYQELFADRLDLLMEIVDASSAADDPWIGLRELIERDFELQANHRGLREFLLTDSEDNEIAHTVRERIVPAYAALVERAQATGQIRADVTHTDVGVLLAMLGTLLDAAADIDPDLWRRYALLILTGIQGDDRHHELPGRPPDQPRLQRILGRWARPSRRRV